MLLNKVPYIIYDLIIIIYNLDKRDINNEKLLKELLSTLLTSSIKKSKEELINDVIIKLNIISKVRELYNEDEVL